MTTPIYLGGALVLLWLEIASYYHRKRHPKFTVALELATPTITVRSTQMQIQAQVNTNQVFNVVALGTQGERMNVPMDFTLSDPTVADLAFDQAAMTLAISFKKPGTATLTETATGTSISNTHTITVEDVVVSVDLEPQVAAPTAEVTPETPQA